MNYLPVLLILGLMLNACSARNYTHYLIEPAPATQESFVEEGTLIRPLGYGSTTMMKVRWNDGDMITEVELPMLATGQRIVIEHSKQGGQVQALPATRLVPPPPSMADEALIDAYRKRGLRLNSDAAEISLTRARTLMQGAIKEGNYQIALEWCGLVLARYPSHPEFLRAKASILLMMGERDKAIEIYETAEEIESDPEVRRTLERLRKNRR